MSVRKSGYHATTILHTSIRDNSERIRHFVQKYFIKKYNLSTEM